MSHQYIKEIRGVTPTAISSAGEILEVDGLSYGIPTGIEIVRVTVKQTAGSASNFSFSIGNKAGFITSTVHEKYLSGSTASSGILDESDVSAFCMTSDAGKLYFKFLPDAGSDNYYMYSIMYKR
jgi:hypothetical protein